jgi:hypothetical protein
MFVNTGLLHSGANGVCVYFPLVLAQAPSGAGEASACQARGSVGECRPHPPRAVILGEIVCTVSMPCFGHPVWGRMALRAHVAHGKCLRV